MAHIIPNGRVRLARVFVQIILSSFAASAGFFSVPAFSQSCSPSAGFNFVRAEGLAEQIGDITVTCTGGTATSVVQLGLYMTLNANITNRIDGSNNLLRVTVTANTGSGPVLTSATLALVSPMAVSIPVFQYTVPAPSTQPVTIVISGIRVAAPTVTGGGASVTGTVFVSGVQTPNLQPLLLASSHAALLDAVLNIGIPCGSPPPQTLDFPGLSIAGTYSSTVRVTEGYTSAFLPKSPTADTGVRIVVSLSGYNANTQVYVPEAIVGSTGVTPTSAGAFGYTYSGGAYTPGSNQLLLVLVNGADATGYGGTWALPAPTVPQSYASVMQIPITNGNGYAVYEVVDSNPNLVESAQIPFFLVVPQTNCPISEAAALAPELGPVSNVSIATPTDPIPRFMATTPGSDCQVISGCAAYLPQLTIAQAAISLNGSSLGMPQSVTDYVTNSGGGQLAFNVSIAYQSPGANWLSVSPTSSVNNTLLTLTANPAALTPGLYQATVTINAGSAGSATVAVTFNLGPVAPDLQVVQSSITLNGVVSGTSSTASVNVVNTHPATGQMTFSVSTVYQFGYASLADINWLSITPTSGTDNTTLTLTANPASLVPGVYQATVVINAGSAGSVNLPVTFNVTAATLPTIQGVVNAANSQTGSIAAGSFAAIYGVNLAPKTTAPPTVTFAGSPATILYDGATQINVLVPAALGSATTAGVVATIDGVASNTFTVTLAPNAPAVFNPGILNQNNSVNSASAPASAGDEIQIFLTGLSTTATPPITVNIGSLSLTGTQIIYAGAVFSSPGVVYPGLEQVNVQVPAALTFTGNSAPLSICVAGTGTQPVCSAAVNLYLK